MSSRVSKETLGDWAAEGKKLKDERTKKEGGQIDDILNASINDLFRPDKTFRGGRRAALVKQRFAEAALENNTRKGKGRQELWESARVGNIDALTDKLVRSDTYAADGKDLSHGIHAAAAHGRDDVIDLLVRHGANPSDSELPQGFTPIMVASAKGHVHALLLLIDRGGDMNATNEMGMTALHLAASSGQAHCVKALVAEGAESWHKDKYGRLPADCAAVDTQQHHKCRELIAMAKRKPKVPDHEDVDPDTPAHHYLVNALHGMPRSGAAMTIQGPSNLV